MDETRKQELIHGDLDGTLSGPDRAELARLLLQDPEARRQHDELRRTEALLRQVPPAEPPPGLRSAILRALGLSPPSSGGLAGGPVLLRYAAAVVGGLLVVGLGYGLLQDEQRLAGLQGSVTATAPARTPVDEVILHADGAEVRARLFHEGAGSRLELESTGTQAIEIVGLYDPAALRPQGVAGDSSGSADASFSIVLTPAQPRYSAEFSGSGPLRLELRGNGQRLGGATIGDDAGG
jgi:hypothetical protein